MVHCAIFGCNSNNNKKLKRNRNVESEKLKFFKFPKEKIHEQIWVKKCGRQDEINVKNASICSKHFSQDCYVRNLQHELLNYSPKSSKKLKSDAIPTENLPFPETHDKLHEERPIEPKSNRNDNDKEKELRTNKIFIISDEIVPVRLIGPMPTICPEPLRIDKSTNTENVDKRLLLETQAELQELHIKHKGILAENRALKKEIEFLMKIFTPAQRKMLKKAYK